MGRVIFGFSLLVLLFGFLYMEIAWATVTCKSGVVLGRDYDPEESSVGTGVSSGGKAVVTSHYSSEKYILHIETDKGVVISGECSGKMYFSKEDGDSITICTSYGYFTGLIHENEITR